MLPETSGPEPTQSLFDLAPLTVDQAEAYAGLLSDGCHVVLCTAKKSPVWTGWNRKRATYDDVWHHDGPIALIPASRRLVVFDADSGTPDDIAAFAQKYPPIVRLPSRQSGRWHFYYTATQLIKNSVFQWRTISGDVRSHAGYVILWGENAAALRKALLDSNRTSAQAPLHLIQKKPPQARERTARKPGPSSERDRPANGSSSPGPTLFDALRYWAYQTRRGTDRSAWGLHVFDEAQRLTRELPAPLSMREVASMAESVAEWVWTHFRSEYRSEAGRWTTEEARQMGIASGVARRRGTVRERDRQPWVTEGISQRTWMRRRTNARPASSVPQTEDPHLALGISKSGWRQRLRRARMGGYRGARAGVPPWEYLAISEPEWGEYYAAGAEVRPPPFPNKNCHTFGTEQIVGRPPRRARGERGETGAGLRDTGVGPAQGEALQTPPVGEQRASPSVAKKKPPCPKPTDSDRTSRERKAAIRRIKHLTEEIVVDEYLRLREPGYELELRLRGLTPHRLRRPVMPFPEYVGSDPKHRQRYAIEMRQKAKHDMEIAHELYAKERALELVPDVPPWEQGDPDDILVDGYLEDRREWMRETRHFWRRDLADEYVIDRVLLLDRDEPPLYCLAPGCYELRQERDVLCPRCRGHASRLAPCPHCGDCAPALLFESQAECPICMMATPAEREARTNVAVAGWARLRAETVLPRPYHPGHDPIPGRRRRRRR